MYTLDDAPKIDQTKIELLKNSISPLAAVLLFADYSYPELELAVKRFGSKEKGNDFIYIGSQIFLELLRNKKNKLNSSYNSENDFNKLNRSNLYQCDFKEAMRILNKSKGALESLILNNEIRPFNHSRGKKRYFLTTEILDLQRKLNSI